VLYLRLALVMATALNGFAHAADLLQSRDVFDLELATDVQISPDGRQVAYVRRSMDIMTDRVRDNIWLISTDGKRHRPLLSGLDTYSSPRWSPSGDRIAYVSNAEGRGRQLHVRWMDTGEIALVSDLPHIAFRVPPGTR
jgi:dipeptidyl aminopeptidase/acylaminoacyl peptidase